MDSVEPSCSETGDFLVAQALCAPDSHFCELYGKVKNTDDLLVFLKRYVHGQRIGFVLFLKKLHCCSRCLFLVLMSVVFLPWCKLVQK